MRVMARADTRHAVRQEFLVFARLLRMGLGVLLVFAGIAMLVLPGPGLLAIAAGGALVLSQWAGGRRTLARLRLWLRERYGSRRVGNIEARIPDEVCPPAATIELQALVDTRTEPPASGRDDTAAI